jgi:hypothetical protein
VRSPNEQVPINRHGPQAFPDLADDTYAKEEK